MIALAKHLQIPVREWFEEKVKPDLPPKILDLLAQMEKIHGQTYEHLLRVSWLARCIGEFAGCYPAELQKAGLLHDIGQIKLAHLLGRTEWTYANKEAMKAHSICSYEMLFPIFPLTAEIVVRHHCFQEDPYPNPPPPLRWEFMKELIQKIAFMVSLADCYDALHRDNSRNGKLNGAQIKQKILVERPQAPSLIHALYWAGIFQE